MRLPSPNRDSRNARDAALVARFQAGDESAFDELHSTYNRLLHLAAERHFHIIRVHDPASNKDDLLQVASVALYRAACDYRPENKTAFLTFVHLYVHRAVFTYSKTAGLIKRPRNKMRVFSEKEKARSEYKQSIANKVLELESPLRTNTETELMDVLVDPTGYFENAVLERIDIDALIERAGLSDLQRRAIDAWLSGQYPSFTKAFESVGVTSGLFTTVKQKMRDALVAMAADSHEAVQP